MSALHWICALTLALVCCLTAQPVKRDVIADSVPDFIKNFTSAYLSAGCLDKEATYYAPTNLKANNLVAALKCYLVELDVIYEECHDGTDKYKDLKDAYDNLSWTLKVELTKLKNKRKAGTHDDFICESSHPVPFEMFMTNIENLVQLMNSQKNCEEGSVAAH